MSEIQKVAKKVLKDESEGIELLKDFFDDNFSSAIKKILDIKGKVIVTGVGKSGHIGKKISATLSSTGTPSYFGVPTAPKRTASLAIESARVSSVSGVPWTS